LGKAKRIGIGIGIAILAFFAFGIISASLIDNNMGASVKEEVSVKQIGDISHLKYFTIEVTKSPIRAGSDFWNKPQGIFYIVEVEIENTGKKTRSFSSNQFTLIDGKGREYEIVYYFNMNDSALSFVDIQPALSVTKLLVFDIPYDYDISYHLDVKNAGLVCLQKC